MTLKYWNNFSKKENSTEQPLDSAAVTVSDVRLKDDTSYLNPTFILTDTHAPTTMTYISWQGRFYFITDRVKRNNSIVEISCECDVLASFKTAIGNYTAFVERSASSYDTYAYDNLLCKKESSVITYSSAKSPFTDMINELPTSSLGGGYVLRVVGQNSIKSFLLTQSEVDGVLNYAFSDHSNYPISSTSVIPSDIIKSLFNPFQYIVSLLWVPITPSTPSLGSAIEIKLGWWGTGISKVPLYHQVYQAYSSITIPHTYNDFRDYSNDWCNYFIYVPGCGQVQLDASLLKGHSSLYVDYTVDMFTGTCSAIVSTGTHQLAHNDIITTLSGSVGVNIQIGQQGSMLNGALSSAGALIGTGMSGNIVGLATNGLNLIGNALSPTPSVLGSNSDVSQLFACSRIVITKITKETLGESIATNGKPLYQSRTLNTLSGYIKCAGASINIDGFKSERDKINSYLNSGFYYE